MLFMFVNKICGVTVFPGDCGVKNGPLNLISAPP